MAPTGKGVITTDNPTGKWIPTQHDPSCKMCGEAKHTHIAGTGPSTENKKCTGFVSPSPEELAALPLFIVHEETGQIVNASATPSA